MIKTFDYPKYYTVSINEDTGEVKITSNSNIAKGRELTQYFNSEGYLRIKLNNRATMVHNLVAMFYLGERPKGKVINHKDGIKTNNRPGNLEYVSIAENISHSVKMGMHVSNDPKRSGRYKDGRASGDLDKYKHEWYIQNRERILKKEAAKYAAKKAAL